MDSTVLFDPGTSLVLQRSGPPRRVSILGSVEVGQTVPVRRRQLVLTDLYVRGDGGAGLEVAGSKRSTAFPSRVL